MLALSQAILSVQSLGRLMPLIGVEILSQMPELAYKALMTMVFFHLTYSDTLPVNLDRLLVIWENYSPRAGIALDR